MPEKPALPQIFPDSELRDFVDQSWFIFCVLGISKEDVKKWFVEDFSSLDSYKIFSKFVRGLVSTNDCAERNIKLIQDFVLSSSKEETRQNIMLVARDHRKKLTKVCNKNELKRI